MFLPFASLVGLILLSTVAIAQDQADVLSSAARPEDAGISSSHLDRLRSQTKADIESKRIPGAVLLIARRGRIVMHEALGYQVRSTLTPMQKDSIFRIASMSKPITSVAIMILSEEGKAGHRRSGGTISTRVQRRQGWRRASHTQKNYDGAGFAPPYLRPHLRPFR